MIRLIGTLIKVAIVIVILVVLIGKLPNRQVNHCTATVTGDDGSVQVVPC